MAARIIDVAEKAGVSVGTVSRVINGNTRVRPDLRARVEAAVKEFGYRPNALARSLRRQRTQTLALVIPDITNPFFGELAKHIEAAATRRGFCLLVGNSMESQRAERLYLETFADRRVDGLILVPCASTVSVPSHHTMPIIVVDRELPDFDVIASDNTMGARSAAEYLVGLGHHLIGFISGPRDSAIVVQRYQGYLSVVEPLLRARGLRVEDYTCWGAFEYQSGVDCALDLLQRRPRPTALFASSDQQAIGALRACADLGLSIPRDLSIIGFDDIRLATLVTPRLTTVAQPIEAIGEHAVARLLDRLSRPDLPPERRLLPTAIQVRDTCGPPACPPAGQD